MTRPRIRGGHIGSVVEGWPLEGTKIIRFKGNNDDFESGKVITFLEMETGFRIAGPVTIETVDVYNHTLYLSSPVTVKPYTGIFNVGFQNESGPPVI